jgi:hypothetical protein
MDSHLTPRNATVVVELSSFALATNAVVNPTATVRFFAAVTVNGTSVAPSPYASNWTAASLDATTTVTPQRGVSNFTVLSVNGRRVFDNGRGVTPPTALSSESNPHLISIELVSPNMSPPLSAQPFDGVTDTPPLETPTNETTTVRGESTGDWIVNAPPAAVGTDNPLVVTSSGRFNHARFATS